MSAHHPTTAGAARGSAAPRHPRLQPRRPPLTAGRTACRMVRALASSSQPPHGGPGGRRHVRPGRLPLPAPRGTRCSTSTGPRWGSRPSSAGGYKLTRSLSQLQARPPLLQAYCLCALRALASSIIPAETLPPTCPKFYLKFFIFEGTFFSPSKRDAMSTNPQGGARTSRSAPNFGCPAATLWNTA